MHLNLNKGIVRIPLLGINNLENLRLAQLSEFNIYERIHTLATPEVIEALYISSPEFAKTIERINEKKIEYSKLLEIWLTFVKYYTRMCSRGTPYGLMASVGVIAIDKKTCLQQEFTNIIHAQLDNGIVSDLSYVLEQSHDLKSTLLYFPNPSLYKQGKKLKYVEVVKREGAKVFALSKIETNVVIEKTLSFCKSGKQIAEITSFIHDAFKEVYDKYDIEELIFDLISNQVILSNFSSSATKQTLFSHIAETLSKTRDSSTQSTKIALINAELKKIDKLNWDENKNILYGIESNLGDLKIPLGSASAFHFNLIRSFSKSSINANIAEKIKVANELIGSVNESYRSEDMEAFKSAFIQRYENKFVLLTEVLDEEIGIGYPVGNIRNSNKDGSLDGINIPQPVNSYPGENNFNSLFLFLFNKISELKISGSKKIELTSADLKTFATNKTKLPPTYATFCTLLGNSAQDIDEDNFEVIISNSAFTSASSPINRFSGSDPEVETLCKEIVEYENNIFADKIVAEVLHTPNSRIENITFRAVTRDYEIPVESLSTHDATKQIKLDDIWVTVVNNSIKLISKSNHKEIVPRISNSHSFSHPESLPAYRFLGDLQLQDQQNLFLWRWGPLTKLDFLPRVVINKHIICSLATWRISLEKGFFQSSENLAKKLMDRLISVGLPKHVSIRQNNDNLLVLDIEDPTCLTILLKEFKKSSFLLFHEYLITSNNSVIKDTHGNSYVNELIVPYLVEKTDLDKSNTSWLVQRKFTFKDKRSFFPGDDFLYVKIYCTKNIGQMILLRYISPMFFESQGISDCIFFIRYEDPDYHIRLRIRKENNSILIHEIHEKLQKLISQKYIHKIQLDTYNRELDRYSIIPYDKTEMIFSVDSKAIVDMLRYLDKTNNESQTWIIALKNIHSYLASFGMSMEEMLSFCFSIRNDFFAELRLDSKDFLKSLNAKLKSNYSLIAGIITEKDVSHKKLYQILTSREKEISQILNTGEKDKIKNNYAQFSSYIHMSLNRLFASDERFKEAMSYDLLYNFLLAEKNVKNRILVEKKNLEDMR